MNTSRTLGLTAVALVFLATARPASAQTAINLYNTGVDNTGAVLALGSVDPHYTQVTPAGNPAAYTYYIGAYAFPTGSLYIAPDRNGGGSYLSGVYTVDYQTTFSLTGLNPASVVISGDWSTDNLGNDILINGHSTGLTSTGFGSFTHFDLTPFKSDFQAGVNTLDFVWTNQTGPGALDVQNLTGTAAPAVPEASTTVSFGLLLALGMGGAALSARKKKAAQAGR